MAPKSRWGRKERDGTRVQTSEQGSVAVLPVRQRSLPLREAECSCNLIENYFTIAECSHFFELLTNMTEWKKQEVTLQHIQGKGSDGKTVGEPRMTLFMSDPGICYAYSGRDNEGVGWTPWMLEIKGKTEKALEELGLPPVVFNSVQMNRYNHPRHTLGLHMDNEPDLLKLAPIASVSFGAPRDFVIQHGANPEESYTLELTDGSFCLMAGKMQMKYLHGIPVGASGLRFNLTFRVCIPRNGSPPPQPQVRPGDWECPTCKQMSFRRHLQCRHCGADKPEAARVPGSAPVSASVPAPASAPVVGEERGYPSRAPSSGWGKLSGVDEKRTDPHDGRIYSFKELKQRYAGTHTEAEISSYWQQECKATFDAEADAAAQVPVVPRRRDPEDGRIYSCEELLREYKGQFSDSEIRAYYRDECTPG
eukprot:TRINITY_DN108811_c0_g1_i1.p1 TRINITY_DN108811_c0_g1~~TRINITY_DN108811_c0_g1_i1.p1  ORF type:complete len:421 (+),score=55.08 TRINITY_DN108811_c0_g1_i1:13-1275(+)